jgi:hypothetical protein
MNLDSLKNPVVQKAAAIFAAGYAKRMLEGQYNRAAPNFQQHISPLPNKRPAARPLFPAPFRLIRRGCRQ